MAQTELRQRIISGIILGAAVIALTLWSFESFAAMCAVGFVILIKEWWHLTKQSSRWWLLVGVVYITSSILALLYLQFMSQTLHYSYIFYLFAIVWGGDVAAYFIGKKFGKHKIAPAISPGKSWEGLAASVIFASSLSVLILYRDMVSSEGHASITSYAAMALLGAILSCVGLAGDMFESSLKRRAGVKDSGTLIPGHGGLFDRVDALMPCAITLAAILYLFMTTFRLF
jgi:phosphatidate cytidylyltransferase